MRTFTYVPKLDINCTYQIFAHRSCAILLTKITMFPYSEQVQSETLNTTVQVLDMIWMINEIIQEN